MGAMWMGAMWMGAMWMGAMWMGAMWMGAMRFDTHNVEPSSLIALRNCPAETLIPDQ
jgi:hypothetical protein